MEPLVLVHAGTSSPQEFADGCVLAAQAGAAALAAGAGALGAAVAAVEVLEEDGRFNAGRGSYLRLDGLTVEMDAGLMDSRGRIGAVAALRGFLHPIRAAREVLKTPHCLLAGEGAGRFARARGLAPLLHEPTEKALEKHRRAVELIRERTSRRPEWRDADPDLIWNFEGPLPEELRPSDTVGAVVRDAMGAFAAANSTGGAVPMMLGRVGDSPLPGAGFWAGPAGAVVTTGVGEEILRRLAAREIYEFMSSGLTPDEAIARTLSGYPDTIAFGAVAIDGAVGGIGANREMATGSATS